MATTMRSRLVVTSFASTAGVSGLLLFYVLNAPAETTTKPNRTLPQFEPPRTSLEFTTNPSADEIFRARVFEEPLVPVGKAPGVEENRALAAALVGYSKRSGPDDFSALTGFLKQ